jgi:hypothetical protein
VLAVQGRAQPQVRQVQRVLLVRKALSDSLQRIWLWLVRQEPLVVPRLVRLVVLLPQPESTQAVLVVVA